MAKNPWVLLKSYRIFLAQEQKRHENMTTRVAKAGGSDKLEFDSGAQDHRVQTCDPVQATRTTYWALGSRKHRYIASEASGASRQTQADCESQADNGVSKDEFSGIETGR